MYVEVFVLFTTVSLLVQVESSFSYLEIYAIIIESIEQVRDLQLCEVADTINLFGKCLIIKTTWK